MRRLVPVAVLAALFFLPAAQGASPASGTVSPAGATVQYQGGPISAVPPAASRRVCVEGQNCDTFDLVVDVPANFYATSDRVLTVTITNASWGSLRRRPVRERRPRPSPSGIRPPGITG